MTATSTVASSYYWCRREFGSSVRWSHSSELAKATRGRSSGQRTCPSKHALASHPRHLDLSGQLMTTLIDSVTTGTVLAVDYGIRYTSPLNMQQAAIICSYDEMVRAPRWFAKCSAGRWWRCAAVAAAAVAAAPTTYFTATITASVQLPVGSHGFVTRTSYRYGRSGQGSYRWRFSTTRLCRRYGPPLTEFLGVGRPWMLRTCT